MPRAAGYRRAVGYDVVRRDSLAWEERPGHEGQAARHAATITDAAQMTESRARMWRYPPHVRGKRHLDPDQEEVFVPIAGTLTMLLGEPPERVDVSVGGLVHVEHGTELQTANHGDEDLLVYVHGSPPEDERAELLESAL